MSRIIRPDSIFRLFRGGKKRGRKVKVKSSSGKTKTVQLHKGLPKGCSSPKRICIKCLKTVIRKNDKNYESKICKGCQTA